MDIYCLKSGINQSDEEQNAHLEELRDSIAPGSETEGGGTADGTAEQGQRLRVVLDLLASGTIESICFRSPDVLARSEEEMAKLKSFLSEHAIGLIGPNLDDSVHGREGADVNDIGKAQAS